jgi:ubiquinone/menaquinone biosynthesis C-methylase UbiE
MRKEQLDGIRRAYDLTVRQYREGSDPLAGVPEEFRNSAVFKAFLREGGPAVTGSNAPEIREFLSPQSGMRFLDVGCCANLANYSFAEWPSLYYGIDISSELIGAMKRFATCERIPIGGLEVAEAAALPFAGDYFDIAMAVGVFEYVDLDYIETALVEMSRVLKADAKAVVDIPNMAHPHAGTMVKLEEYLARPIFPHARAKFEKTLSRCFNIEKTEDQRVMLTYFVKTKKKGSKDGAAD